LAQIKRNQTDWYCPFCAEFQAHQKGVDPRNACLSCGQPRPATLRAAAEAAEAVSRGLHRRDTHVPARPLAPGWSGVSARSSVPPFPCSPAAPAACSSRDRGDSACGEPAGPSAGPGSITDEAAACCLNAAELSSSWRQDERRLQVWAQPAEAPPHRLPLASRHSPPHPQVRACTGASPSGAAGTPRSTRRPTHAAAASRRTLPLRRSSSLFPSTISPSAPLSF
jgi:hypothetical protein